MGGRSVQKAAAIDLERGAMIEKPKAALYHVDVICVESRSILADTEDLEQTKREYGHSFEYRGALIREVLPNEQT